MISKLLDRTHEMIHLGEIDRRVKRIAKPYCLVPRDGISLGIGIFFIHGYASTPQVFRKYAIQLSELGYHCYVARVAGHGTSPAHLSVVSYKEWIQGVYTQYQQFRDDYNITDVIIMGHSLGANLAICLAASVKPRGLLLISTPMKIKVTIFYKLRCLIPTISKFIKFFLVSEKKLELIRQRGAIVYHKHPLYGFYEWFKLQDVAYGVLEKITCRTMLIIGSDDEFVYHESHEILRNQLRSEKIDEWIAPHGSHAIIDTTDYHGLEQRIVDFLSSF